MLPFEGPAAQGTVSEAGTRRRQRAPTGKPDCLIKEQFTKVWQPAGKSTRFEVEGKTPQAGRVREGCGYGFQMSPTDVVTAPTTRGRSVEEEEGLEGKRRSPRAHQR